MRRWGGLLLFWLLFAPVILAAVDQTEIPVTLRAEKLRYYDNSSLVEALGSVEVEFSNAKIKADSLIMDTATDVATAEGNVRLFSRDYDATADQMVYNISSESFVFLGFKSKNRPKNIKGELYISAKQLTDYDQVMRGEQGTITTCGADKPHFSQGAQAMTYYPDDHAEGANSLTYVGRLPVMWLPYIRYEMKKPMQKMFNFGHNDVEGDFVKTAWAWPAGLLLIDLMEKKGIGLGNEYKFNNQNYGLGRLYLYQVNEKDTGLSDWVFRLDDEKMLNEKTKLKFSQRYTSIYQIPSGRLDQTALSLNVSYADKDKRSINMETLDDRLGNLKRYTLQFNQQMGGTFLTYGANYDYAKTAPLWMRGSQTLGWRQALLNNRVNFSFNSTYNHSTAYAGDSGQERVAPAVEFTGAENWFNWRYSQNWFIDLRQYLSPGIARYESTEKQPEIEINPRAIDFKLFSLASSFGFGNYREVKTLPQLGIMRDFTASRFKIGLNAPKSLPAGPGTTLSLGAGLDQQLYSPGDQLYAYRENAGLTTDLGGWFRNELAYRKGSTDGNSPFFFDKLNTTFHEATEKITFYRGNQFRWSFTGGRNWQTNKWYDLMTYLSVTPHKNLRWALDSGWDIENTKYKDLVTSLGLVPSDIFALSLALRHDLNLGEVRSASALYDLYFMKGAPNQMHVTLSQVYDTSSRELKLRDIAIVKDLHCWEMRYAYSDYRKEFSFTFRLKAMPDEPFGYASGRGFYFEGFQEAEKQLKNLKMEGEIRRY